jgi:hypothetical protein
MPVSQVLLAVLALVGLVWRASPYLFLPQAEYVRRAAPLNGHDDDHFRPQFWVDGRLTTD